MREFGTLQIGKAEEQLKAVTERKQLTPGDTPFDGSGREADVAVCLLRLAYGV